MNTTSSHSLRTHCELLDEDGSHSVACECSQCLEPEAAYGVEVVQVGAMKGCVRVEGICPACGVRGLALGKGARVTCGNLACPNPSQVDDMLDPR